MYVIPESGKGRMRKMCIGKWAAEQRRRAKNGLPPLSIAKPNQEVEKVPSIRFPVNNLGYVHRFRMEVMGMRPEV